MTMILKFYKESVTWSYLNNIISKHHFELLSKHRVRCISCRIKIANKERASLCDIPYVLTFKKDAIARGHGELELKEFNGVRCYKCFMAGVGLVGNDIHHRIIVNYIKD